MRRPVYRTVAPFALSILAICAGGEALANQPPCGPRDAIVDRLSAKWGEEFVGGGLQSSANMFEVYMSAENGTWTILKTDAYGRACVMATGTNWLESLGTEKLAGIES